MSMNSMFQALKIHSLKGIYDELKTFRFLHFKKIDLIGFILNILNCFAASILYGGFNYGQYIREKNIDTLPSSGNNVAGNFEF